MSVAPLMTETAAPAPTRAIATELFGTLDVRLDHLIEFRDGIPGFPECRQWVLIDGAKPGTVWLQSVDHRALAFFLVDPFPHFAGYAVDLTPSELRRLGADDSTAVAVFAIVTLPAARELPATVNLQAPVAVDLVQRRAAQIVVSESAWTVREPLDLARLG